MTTWCLMPNLISYLAASLLYLFSSFTSSPKSTESKRLSLERSALVLTLFGALLQVVYFSYHYFVDAGIHLIDQRSDQFGLLSLGIISLFLWSAWRKSWVGLGSFFVPLALILFIFSMKNFQSSVHSPWLVTVHISLAILTFLFLLGSFLLGVAFLIQQSRLKSKRLDHLFLSLPPLVLSEEKALAWSRWGFVLLTLVLVSGSWLISVERHFDSLHVLLALSSWAFYAGVINKRWSFERKKILLLSILGFASLTFSFLWNSSF